MKYFCFTVLTFFFHIFYLLFVFFILHFSGKTPFISLCHCWKAPWYDRTSPRVILRINLDFCRMFKVIWFKVTWYISISSLLIRIYFRLRINLSWGLKSLEVVTYVFYICNRRWLKHHSIFSEDNKNSNVWKSGEFSAFKSELAYLHHIHLNTVLEFTNGWN